MSWRRLAVLWSAARRRISADAPGSSALLLAGGSQAAIADQLATLFIPKTKSERLEAREQRDGLDALKQRLRFVALLQVIIRNARTQMMNVMKPDVAGEPLQDLGQFVERTALQRRRGVIPFLGAFPVNSLELVLNIKQPHAGRAGDSHHHQLNQEVRFKAENPAQPGGQSQDCQI